METGTFEAQLADLRRELDRNTGEREVLLAAVNGLQGLVDYARSVSTQTATPTVTSVAPATFAGTVLEVLRSSGGEPMHTSKIYEAAAARGAVSRSTKPQDSIDVCCYSLKKRGYPLERVDTRVWHWIGGEC